MSNNIIHNNRNVVMFGIQPSGCPHIGNYLCLMAAIKDSKLLICCIANLHTLSSSFISKKNMRLTIAFLASMLQNKLAPKQSIIYSQAMILNSCHLN